MLRASLVAAALVAVAQGTPISEPTKTVQERQFTWGDPSTWFGSGGNSAPPPSPTMIILPPIVGGIEPADKRSTTSSSPSVQARQFTWGDPSTWFGPGSEQPAPATPTTTILPPITGGLHPPRQVLGGGDDAEMVKALELEIEALMQAFGNAGEDDAPWPVRQRLRALEAALRDSYGIVVVRSPDGTSSTFVPGRKRRAPRYVPGGPLLPPTPGAAVPGGPLLPPAPAVPGGPMVPARPVLGRAA
ncbi:hypothetical protein F4780DRAFT_797880 [Xylariomycetidae sp. FL0641]|nr:hypothetical protein F4780DRAFT_797880 [Xylariomycetidae sp. FL0641]